MYIGHRTQKGQQAEVPKGGHLSPTWRDKIAITSGEGETWGGKRGYWVGGEHDLVLGEGKGLKP